MCECNCKCAVPGEIRRKSATFIPGPLYAIRDHVGRWFLVNLVKGDCWASHDHCLDQDIESWPVVYRPA